MGIVSLSMVQWLLWSLAVLNLLNLTLAGGDSKISCMKCFHYTCVNWKNEVKTLKAERCPFYEDGCSVHIDKESMDKGEGIKAVYDRDCRKIENPADHDDSMPGCHETEDVNKKPIIICVCTGDGCNGGNNLTAIMEAANRSAENFNFTAYKQLMSDKKSMSSQMLSGITIWIAGFLALIVLYWV